MEPFYNIYAFFLTGSQGAALFNCLGSRGRTSKWNIRPKAVIKICGSVSLWIMSRGRGTSITVTVRAWWTRRGTVYRCRISCRISSYQASANWHGVCLSLDHSWCRGSFGLRQTNCQDLRHKSLHKALLNLNWKLASVFSRRIKSYGYVIT